MDGLSHFTVGGTLVLGRGPNCDLNLEADPEVSERHARLVAKNDLIWLEDLASTTGTWIGSDPLVQPIPVSPGVVFSVGRTLIEILPDDGNQP